MLGLILFTGVGCSCVCCGCKPLAQVLNFPSERLCESHGRFQRGVATSRTVGHVRSDWCGALYLNRPTLVLSCQLLEIWSTAKESAVALLFMKGEVEEIWTNANGIPTTHKSCWIHQEKSRNKKFKERWTTLILPSRRVCKSWSSSLSLPSGAVWISYQQEIPEAEWE